MARPKTYETDRADASKLRELMALRGWNAAQAARRLGRTAQSIRDWCRKDNMPAQTSALCELIHDTGAFAEQKPSEQPEPLVIGMVVFKDGQPDERTQTILDAVGVRVLGTLTADEARVLSADLPERGNGRLL